MTLLESDPIILDESEFEVPCDGRLCKATAEWIVTCKRCSYPSFFCPHHLRVVKSWRMWVCDECKAEALRFEDIAEVTPLKGNP